ncbi:MAG: hypothetical protein ACW99U_12915 [Candidatus Thorarchaeota archaeon]|jgi:hypothetical protein
MSARSAQLDENNIIWECIHEKVISAPWGENEPEMIYRMLADYIKMCETCRDYLEFAFLGGSAYIRYHGDEAYRTLMMCCSAQAHGLGADCEYCNQRMSHDIFIGYDQEASTEVQSQLQNERIKDFTEDAEEQQHLFPVDRGL